MQTMKAIVVSVAISSLDDHMLWVFIRNIRCVYQLEAIIVITQNIVFDLENINYPNIITK